MTARMRLGSCRRCECENKDVSRGRRFIAGGCANNNEMMASNGQNDNKETIELVSWRDIALESRTYNRKRGAHRAFHVEPVLSWKSNVEAFPSFVSDNGESRLTDVLPEYPPNPIDSRLSPRGIPDPAVWSVPQK
jgi:hypothetical protein